MGGPPFEVRTLYASVVLTSIVRYVSSRGTQMLHVAGQGLGHYLDFDRQQSHASPERSSDPTADCPWDPCLFIVGSISTQQPDDTDNIPGLLSHLQGSVHICPSRCLAFHMEDDPLSLVLLDYSPFSLCGSYTTHFTLYIPRILNSCAIPHCNGFSTTTRSGS